MRRCVADYPKSAHSLVLNLPCENVAMTAVTKLTARPVNCLSEYNFDRFKIPERLYATFHQRPCATVRNLRSESTVRYVTNTAYGATNKTA